MLSLRGPEFESGDGRLPPIRQEDDPLFQRKDYRENEYIRSESRLSINSPERFVKYLHINTKFLTSFVFSDSLRSSLRAAHLPSIDTDREDSAG